MFGKPIARSFWTFPNATSLRGQYIQLAPLSEEHLDDLWRAAQASPTSFDYLRYGPFNTRQELCDVVCDLAARQDQPFWAVLDHGGVALGWLSICDVFQSDGAFEIGSIWFSPSLQGTRMAREAIFLLMCLGMDTFSYERLVWRCQAQNEKSFRAALNLGFTHEGTWRNAAVVKGWQRDVAWFSILKSEWPDRKRALQRWLLPENFDPSGIQRNKLRTFRGDADPIP